MVKLCVVFLISAVLFLLILETVESKGSWGEWKVKGKGCQGKCKGKVKFVRRCVGGKAGKDCPGDKKKKEKCKDQDHCEKKKKCTGFKCNDGTCLPNKASRCNSIVECGDGSDEASHCLNGCREETYSGKCWVFSRDGFMDFFGFGEDEGEYTYGSGYTKERCLAIGRLASQHKTSPSTAVEMVSDGDGTFTCINHERYVSGGSSKSGSCTVFRCGNDCIWQDGDGSGGTEFKVAGHYATEIACSKKCVELAKNDPTINGATWGIQDTDLHGHCFCERNMHGISSNGNYYTCYLPKDDCYFEPGDGAGGSEFKVGEFSTTAECVAACRKESGVNGVTYGVSENLKGHCFCERGMSSIASNDAYITCKLH